MLPLLFEFNDKESTAVFIFVWDKFEFAVVFELLAPFEIPFTIFVCDEAVRFDVSFFELIEFPLVFGADVLFVFVGLSVEFCCKDVSDALTAAEAVATPAKVAAAEEDGKLTNVVDDVRLEDFPLAFEREEASFNFDDDDDNEAPFVSELPW